MNRYAVEILKKYVEHSLVITDIIRDLELIGDK